MCKFPILLSLLIIPFVGNSSAQAQVELELERIQIQRTETTIIQKDPVLSSEEKLYELFCSVGGKYSKPTQAIVVLGLTEGQPSVLVPTRQYKGVVYLPSGRPQANIYSGATPLNIQTTWKSVVPSTGQVLLPHPAKDGLSVIFSCGNGVPPQWVQLDSLPKGNLECRAVPFGYKCEE